MGKTTGRPAGRPKKQPTFEPPGFKQAARARFIEYARRHGSAALRLLGTDVWRGEMSLQSWAERFNVSGTWVEQWAQEALDSWHAWASLHEAPAARPISRPPVISPKTDEIFSHRDMRRGVHGGSKPRDPAAKAMSANLRRALPAPVESESGGLTMCCPPPDDGQTHADVFSCNLTGTPLARLSHGITIGGDASLLWNDGEDDETAFRRQMFARLDAALDEYFRHAVERGASGSIPEPLDLKIECAALYLLCGVRREDLVRKHFKPESTHHIGKETMYTWLNDVIKLLDLRMPRRGRPLSV